MALGGTGYEVWIHQDNGTRIQLIDGFIALSWAHVINDRGRFSLALDARYDSMLDTDRRVSIWRKPVGGAMYREFYGLMRTFRYATDDNNKELMTVSGPP